MATASRSDRLGIVLRWPIGIALVSWRYMWRTTPLHRSEEVGSSADLPGPPDEDNDTAQGRQPAANLNHSSPEMAVFRKTRGTSHELRRGDEFVVRMPGPWDGPVRVIRRDDTSFRLGTLTGHLEAGEIEFRATGSGDALHFEIESWARAGDRLADVLYNKLRLAKEIQLNMWSHFCVRVAALAGGRPQGGVTIRTSWVTWPPRDGQG
jgi:hypothetical protein